MRKFDFFTAVIVLLASASWACQAHGQSPLFTDVDPSWSVEFSAKAFDRPGSNSSFPVVTDSVTNSVLLTSDVITDLGTTTGAEVNFNFQTRTGDQYQIRTIVAEWDEVAQVTGPNLSSPFFPIPFIVPTVIDYEYESDFFSIELSKRRTLAPGITGTFGPRFISLRDNAVITGTGPAVQSTEVEANNALIGLQGGLEFNYAVSRDIRLQSYIRIGGFTNPTELSTSVSNAIVAPFTIDRTKNTGSFLGEVGVKAFVDIVPGSFSAFLGYEATWIDGFASASDQLLSPTLLETVETGNTEFFNALVGGFQFRY